MYEHTHLIYIPIHTIHKVRESPALEAPGEEGQCVRNGGVATYVAQGQECHARLLAQVCVCVCVCVCV